MMTQSLAQLKIFHPAYNLDKADNLAEIPAVKAVFGIFAIVNDEPANCRYAGETEDLGRTVKELFENPPGEGLRKFMQGSWIQMLVYELVPDSLWEERQKTLEEWVKKYNPQVDDEGEYPGYYDY